MKYRPSPPLIQLRHFVRTILTAGLVGAILDFNKRLFRSVRNHGFRGTLSRFVRRDPIPSKAVMPVQPHPFDLIHGTDTGGFIPGANLSAISLSAVYTTAYLGISPSALTQALSALPIQIEEFTFVDIGCGKGRALIVAAGFPFRHLLGVEIARELCEIARANVATDPDIVDRISIVNQDAANLIYPDGPLLLFLFNPFLAPVLRRVLKNLERQLRHSSRPVYILYADNPRHTEVMNSFSFLGEISEKNYSLSSEDTAFYPSYKTQERFTLYCANAVS